MTALHTVNNTAGKGLNQMAPHAQNHCSTRYEQSFRQKTYTHLPESCYRPRYQAQSLSSSQTTSSDAKPTQHIEITHPHNVNSILAFHKVAYFHQHYSTFTLQPYQHSEHRFRSWPMQITITSTHTSTSAAKKYIQPYLHKVFFQDKTI